MVLSSLKHVNATPPVTAAADSTMASDDVAAGPVSVPLLVRLAPLLTVLMAVSDAPAVNVRLNAFGAKNAPSMMMFNGKTAGLGRLKAVVVAINAWDVSVVSRSNQRQQHAKQ